MSGLQFAPAHVRLILRGSKTQTRRRAKGDDPARWRRGRSYAVQPGRGKPAACRVKVVEQVGCEPCKETGLPPTGDVATCPRCRGIGALSGVRIECLGDLTYEDAVREGYRTRDEYKDAWLRIHDRAWLESMEGLLGCLDKTTEGLREDEALAWLDWTYRTLIRRLRWLERAGAVELAEPDEQGQRVWRRQENAEGLAAAARFEQRWANTPVWVITFELVADLPRYLSSAPPDSERGQGDYVTSPARALDSEAGEAVTVAEQKLITEQAGTTFEHWQTLERREREEERARAGFEARLLTCRSRARLAGVEIDRGIWMIEKMIVERRSPEAILKKLQNLERVLDERKAAA